MCRSVVVIFCGIFVHLGSECYANNAFLDPIALERFENVYFYTTDLDNDGVEEIWISPKNWTNGVAGNSWFVFVLRNGTYQALPELPVVRSDAFMQTRLNG